MRLYIFCMLITLIGCTPQKLSLAQQYHMELTVTKIVQIKEGYWIYAKNKKGEWHTFIEILADSIKVGKKLDCITFKPVEYKEPINIPL